MSKIDHNLFNANAHALEKEFEVCPKCGGELVHRNGKAGPFLGCSQYPSCDYVRSTIAHGLEKPLLGSVCPACGQELVLRQGRYGMFIGCSGFPQCEHIEPTEEQALPVHDCPSCRQGSLVKRKSRYGKTFYACDAYPKCKFAVNYEPVNGACEFCGFTLLVKRQMAGGQKIQCADKKCGRYQSREEAEQ
jgi:putative DNA topoisomerase